MKKSTNKGFTLVELSIVLVIIGLIVGGVLVGQDLVKGAQIRAVVSQIQQYDAAVNAFRGKYDGFPGDHTKAAAFGLGVAGNGNGTIQSGATNVFTGEMVEFWAHLTAANMVAGSYDNTAGEVVGENYPATKLKKGGVVVTSVGAENKWVIGTGSDMTVANTAIAEGLLTPAEAFGIDNKLDDGMPLTGQALAVASMTVAFGSTVGTETLETTGSATTDCSFTGDEYNLQQESNLCTLVIKVQG